MNIKGKKTNNKTVSAQIISYACTCIHMWTLRMQVFMIDALIWKSVGNVERKCGNKI